MKKEKVRGILAGILVCCTVLPVMLSGYKETYRESSYCYVADGTAIPRIEALSVKEDSTQLGAVLANPSGNSSDLQYEVRLSEKNIVLFRSEKLSPGMAELLKEISMPFSQGEYPVDVHIRVFSDGQYENVKMQTILKVEKT